ncbi:hypothetical protein KA005_11955 [bacterium]|nr:hypothetical protein [bacterium]
MSKITNVITLKQYAETHGFDPKRLRRIARNGEFPGDVQPFKFGDTNGRGGVWAIDANAPKITLPDKSERGARRADGRQRYIVFVDTHVTSTEHDAIANIVGIDNIIDPRVAAKSRRDARKLADAETDDKSDYFDAVGELYAAHDGELADDGNG